MAEKVSKKRRGAPKKPPELKQSKRRVVYMTDDTFKQITDKADLAGESFSGYVQKRALEAAE